MQWMRYQGVEQLKTWIEVVDRQYAGVEKNFVDDLVAANPNVIDLEMGLPAWKLPKTAPRIDLVEIVTSTTGPSVVFWEAKLTSDGRMRSSTEVVEDKNPEVLEQLAEYRGFLDSEERARLVATAYENTSRLLDQLRSMANELTGGAHTLGAAILEVASGNALKVDRTARLVVLQDSHTESWAIHGAKLRSVKVASHVAGGWAASSNRLLGSNQANYPTNSNPSHTKPQYDDDRGGGVASRLIGHLLRLRPCRRQYLWWSESHDQCQTKRNQQKVIKVSDDRNEIWNQVNRAECICRHKNRQSANHEGRAWITRSKIHCERVLLQLLGLSFERVKHVQGLDRLGRYSGHPFNIPQTVPSMPVLNVGY
jgi:hypothetical protein